MIRVDLTDSFVSLTEKYVIRGKEAWHIRSLQEDFMLVVTVVPDANTNTEPVEKSQKILFSASKIMVRHHSTDYNN